MHKSLRILIISTFFPPLNSIASLRPYSWAKYWTLAGHDVTVLTTVKDEDPSISLNVPNQGFRVIEVGSGSMMDSLKKEYRQGDKSNCRSSFLKKIIIKAFNYLRFNRGIFNACRFPDLTEIWIRKAWPAIAKKEKWDLVVSSAGPYTVHILAEKLKKKGLAEKWIADYRDPWIEHHAFPGIFPLNLYERHLEKKLMRASDRITTPLFTVFSKKYGEDKVTMIPNGFDFDDLLSLPKDSIFPKDGKVRLVYTGSLYPGKQDPSPLFKVIKEVSEEGTFRGLLDRLDILFCGNFHPDLEALIKKYQVEKRVKQVGVVSREKALMMQRDAHALLFFPWKDSSMDGVLTGKIFEYLASGTPILAIGCPHIEASQKLILEANAGFIFSNEEQIKNYLIQNLNTCSKVRQNVKKEVISRFDRKLLAEKMLQLLSPSL